MTVGQKFGSLPELRAVSSDLKREFQRRLFEVGTAPVIGAPFSATATVQSGPMHLDGNRNSSGQHNPTALQRQPGPHTSGRPVHLQPDPPTSPVPGGITINDPVSGTQYRLQPQQKTFNSRAWRGGPAMHPPVAAPTPSTRMALPIGDFQGAPESECNTVSLGEQVVDGIRVVGTRVDHTIPAGTCAIRSRSTSASSNGSALTWA